MNRFFPPLLLLPLLLMASPAMAEAYKCRQPDGRMVISAEPCADGSKEVKVVPGDPVPDEVRERAEREAERMREQAEKNLNTRREIEKQEQQARERAEMQQPPPQPAVEPVFVPVPYYVGPGQIRPPRPRPPPPTPGKPGKPDKPTAPKQPIGSRGR
ncbi:MAG: DUF4124 domain-containing protein [Azonexus sp.]|uniref:DUF4124 domain-containing protein n=1 Tax=Azonexus sp. TaxID=1872668 RepID=UPI00281EB714|nr:DUF4124 domain-containing protein [Azonexus sp.]